MKNYKRSAMRQYQEASVSRPRSMLTKHGMLKYGTLRAIDTSIWPLGSPSAIPDAITRRHTGRTAVISFSGPFPAEVYHVPFPIEYHGVSAGDSLAALDRLFKADVEADRVAAIIIEPIQGEGGFYPAPDGFLQQVRELCDQHGIVMIADEIQTGFGRTGKLFASEHAGVEADLMTVAKGLAGGFPLSGVVGKAGIMDSVEPGGLGGTVGGSPIGCAAAHAVLDIIEREDLCTKALAIGEQVREWAVELQGTSDCIGDIRISGAMSAIELVDNADADKPAVELTKAISAEAAKRGVIVLTCGVRANVIRFLPPLTIGEELLAEALRIISDIIREKTGVIRKAS